MKRIAVIAAAGAFLLVPASASLADELGVIGNSQLSVTGGQGIKGRLDLATGEFQPSPAVTTAPRAALQIRNGRVTVSIDVTIRSPGMHLQEIGCLVFAYPSPSARSEGNYGGAVGTISGTNGHCVVPFSYQWRIDPATAKLGAYFVVVGIDQDGNQVRGYSRNITPNTGDPIPPNNGTVSYSEAVIF